MNKRQAQNHSIREVEQLLCQAKNGDTIAEGMLITMLEPLIKNRCRRYFGYCDEDLLQLGSIRMIELIRGYDHRRCDHRFVGYADRMISCFYWNLKKSELRKAKELQSTDYAEDQLKLICYHEKGFERIEVNELLAKLSDEQRYIVQENVMRGTTLKHVAAKLGIAHERAKYQKKKALMRLKEMMRGIN